jgi:hypothetical protein
MLGDRQSRLPRAARLTGLAAATALALGAAGAGAQQQFPANGLLFHGEAGGTGQDSLFSAQTSTGSLKTLSITIVEGARVPDVARTGGQKVGQLLLDSVPSALTLRLPAHPTGRSLPLLRRGTLRVTFLPHAKTALRLSGLPAHTARVELTLRGGRGRLLTARGCRDEQNFTATATRGGATSPVHTTAGVTC